MSVLAASFAGWPLLGVAATLALIAYAYAYRNRPDDQ